ncbi:MAG TPA: DUF6597 domain-containing transcriptional factor [Chitinophagaceae bacterium]|nr:DUF6597 domain-containing transcriptional factor [Chitinophagaceae bacterium]
MLTPFTYQLINLSKGIVEVIFNFSEGSPIQAQLDGTQYQLPNCFINGFNTAPIRLRLPKQQVFFGILFQPLAIKKIFGSPACEFSDIPIDLTLLDPAFDSLWSRYLQEDSEIEL